MPPSVDSTCTPSACVTPRSTPRKRNSCFSKVVTENLGKKSRGSSSLSETSPRRPDNRDVMGQLTQESERKRSSLDMIDAYVHVDVPPPRRQQGRATAQTIDGVPKRAKFGNSASQDVDGSITSMIRHSECLAGSILAAYEKEMDEVNRGSSAILSELAQLRTSSEAAAAELPQLRIFHAAATTELAQLRISNEAAAAEVEKLHLENANLAKKEASTSSKLDELQRRCTMTVAVNIVAAFIMSKALVLREAAEMNGTASSEIAQLRLENAQIIEQLTEIEAKEGLQVFNLRSSLAAANTELTKLRSEKAELAKEMGDMEATTRSATHDLLRRLAGTNEEVKQAHSKIEALLREKDEAAARAADAAAVELDKMESRNETVLREMHTAIEMTGREMENMHSIIESTTASLRKLFLEKEEIARDKAESEARAKIQIAQLLSERAELVVENEKTSNTALTAARDQAESEARAKIEIAQLLSERAELVVEFKEKTSNTALTAAREFKNLTSRFEAAVEKLKIVRQATGMEKANLQSEIAAKNVELEGLRKKLVEAQADMAIIDARGTAEIHRLRREKEDSHVREAALLEKIQSMGPDSPRARSEMHLAFLINCGLLRPEEYNLSFMSHGCS